MSFVCYMSTYKDIAREIYSRTSFFFFTELIVGILMQNANVKYKFAISLELFIFKLLINYIPRAEYLIDYIFCLYIICLHPCA